jgi:CMP/dCMP kinase
VIIAVDGPSASGKSTVARGVAEALGLRYLDSGSLYRAVTWAILDRGVDPMDAEGGTKVARVVELSVLGPGLVAVSGRDVSREIRGPLVTAAVSAVSAHPLVRHELVEFQRRFVGEGGAVVEGRDIGTVVFPDALLKVFLTASLEERARRRSQEAGSEEAGRDLVRRDRIDSTRATAPLAVAPDAVVIDTTGREALEVVEEVVQHARKRAGGR